MPTIRAVLLGLLSLLTATGLLPPELHDVIRDNVDAVVAGLAGLWAITAGYRAWRERQRVAR